MFSVFAWGFLRSFTDLDALIGRVPAGVVIRLSVIDFGRGSEALYRDQMPGLLTELTDRTRVLSITASSAIEGVIVADVGRAQRIINRRATTPSSPAARPRPRLPGPSSSASASTSCATRRSRSASPTSGRQCQV
jgi:hypothetical protein